jgi:hypothetical protein
VHFNFSIEQGNGSGGFGPCGFCLSSQGQSLLRMGIGPENIFSVDLSFPQNPSVRESKGVEAG